MGFFKKLRVANLIAALILVAVGVVFLFAASFIRESLCMIAGIALMVYGIVRIMRHLINKESFVDSMLIGVLLAMFGYILMTKGTDVVAEVWKFMGILIALDGVFKLKESFEAKGASQKDWIAVLICSLVVMGFGILVVVNPFSNIVAVIILGIAMILAGGQNVYASIRKAVYEASAEEAPNKGEWAKKDADDGE